MLKSLLPDEVKVNITDDDIRLRSNLSSLNSKRFNKKSSLYTIPGFTQSYLGPLGDIEGLLQLIPGSYKSDKPINITRFGKIHLKRDCNIVSIANGVREPILYKFALDKSPGRKIYEKSRIKLFKQKTDSVLSHKAFYVENDDPKAVYFNGETIGFTCQLIEI